MHEPLPEQITPAPKSVFGRWRTWLTTASMVWLALAAHAQTTCTTPATYATLPYTQTFESDWIDKCATKDAPSVNWKGTASPTDADASWRRDDDGASAGWSGPTAGAYSPTGSQGTHSARFHTYWASNNTVGTLDLYANLSYNGDKILQFYYINTSGADSLTVHVSTDGGATFGPALLRLNQAATWTRQQLRLTNVISATAVIRFRGRSDYGSTDIGVDDLLLRTDAPCTAPPTAGTTVASATSGCVGLVTSLSLQGASSGSGLTYQWQQSSNGTTYTNITGATGETYTSAPLLTTTYFRAVVTCSGQSVNSAPVTVTLAAPTYATMPFAQDFEADWIDVCATRDAPTNSWRTIPDASDANTAWRRDDDGASAGWTNITSGQYTPAGAIGSAHSARFHAYQAASGKIGMFDLYINLSQAGDKILQFDYINTSGTDSLAIHVSTDGGVTFGPALLRLNQASTWSHQLLTLSNTTATTVIRFRGRSDYGVTDIGLDNVDIRSASACFAPASLTVGVVTSTTAAVSWTGVGAGTGYVVEYGRQGFIPGGPNGTVLPTQTSTTATLTNLTPGVEYEFYVSRVCADGSRQRTGPVSFFTRPANDECASAQVLVSNATCSATPGT
ncbi:fibronectin type III domain-containing protein, partial [Hymenobacter jeollabukensis]